LGSCMLGDLSSLLMPKFNVGACSFNRSNLMMLYWSILPQAI
jgi:hypothetical protein